MNSDLNICFSRNQEEQWLLKLKLKTITNEFIATLCFTFLGTHMQNLSQIDFETAHLGNG